MTVLPIFPLESALMPQMPLLLRVFEPRYLALLSHVLEGRGEFGVVLIERGSEVGGGDQRFGIGTVARVAQVAPEGAWMSVLAHGVRRFDVDAWLPDDPYPRADVRWRPALRWEPGFEPVRARAERVVRGALTRASEFVPQAWTPDVELADDPVQSCWQLAGISPLGPLDQLALLRSGSVEELLARLIEFTEDAAASWS